MMELADGQCAGWQVVVDPLLWQYAEYYTGSLLQVHILHHDNSGNSSVVASGEPSLLLSCKPPLHPNVYYGG